MTVHIDSNLDTALYARGFLITDRAPVGIPDYWKSVPLGYRWMVYHDPRTPLHVEDEVLLLGHAIDPDNPTDSIQDTVARLSNVHSRSAFQDIVDRLCGRFLVLNCNGDRLRLQQDACGLRAVYHTAHPYRFVAGSHQNLVAVQVGISPGVFSGQYLRDNNMEAYPGRATESDEIYRMLPNCELSSEDRRLTRIFPRHELVAVSVEEAMDIFTQEVEIQLQALPKDRPLMASLSAGLDSRVTMALLRDYVDRVTFFTYDLPFLPRNDGNRHDRETALLLADRFSLNHVMLDIPEPPDSMDFEELMSKNTLFPHSRALALAYQQRLPSRALHLRSNLFEIGRAYYRNMGIAPETVSANSMRYIVGNGKSFDPGALRAFEEYRTMTDFDLATSKGYDGLDLFYWEHRMGSWLSPILHESDIAHETHVVINSRRILNALLGVAEADRISASAFTSLIWQLWPDIAQIPVNGVLLQRK